MLRNLPRLIREFRQDHHGPLLLIIAEALPRYGSAIVYALLTVLFAKLWNAEIAGIAFGLLALFELFITDPLGGAVADRFGARITLELYAISMLAAGALLWLAPQTTWI